MKKLFFASVLFLAVAVAKAQTVDEIINKHIEAMGGKEKLASIKTVYMAGVIVMQNGSEININTWIENNKLYRRESESPMGKRIQLITDKGGWFTDREGNFAAMKDEMYLRQQYQMDCEGPLVNYAAKVHRAELLGKETVEGKELYKIKLTLKAGNELNYYVDAATYYIDRVSFKGGGMGARGGGAGANPDAEITIKYSNYNKTENGYIFPFTTSFGGGFGGNINFETIEVNKPIEESKYKAE